jgi:hypothetical protein
VRVTRVWARLLGLRGAVVEHPPVDGIDLVRERIEIRRLYREERIEHPRQVDAASLGGQPEEASIGIKRPWLTGRLDREARLILAVDQLLTDVPGVVSIRERHRARSVPLGLQHCHGAVRDKALEPAARREFFQVRHAEALYATTYRLSAGPAQSAPARHTGGLLDPMLPNATRVAGGPATSAAKSN